MSPTKQQLIEIIQEQPDTSSPSEIMRELALHLTTHRELVDADLVETSASFASPSQDESLPVDASDSIHSLEEVVSRIQALKPDPEAVHSATKPIDEVAADLDENPPSADLLRHEELLSLWQQFEQELKELDFPAAAAAYKR